MNYLAAFVGSLYGMAHDPFAWIVLLIAALMRTGRVRWSVVVAFLVAALVVLLMIVEPANARAGLLAWQFERISWLSFIWFSFHAIGLAIRSFIERITTPRSAKQA